MIDPSHDFDQRGFPRAVFSQQGMDFTRVEIKRYIVECSSRIEALGNMSHLEHGCFRFNGYQNCLLYSGWDRNFTAHGKGNHCGLQTSFPLRSEERRVGKECR